MEKNIVCGDASGVSAESLLASLHMDQKVKKGELYDRITDMHREAAKIAKPIAIYAPFSPDMSEGGFLLNGVEIKEPFVRKMLSDCEIVVPYVASCGREIDEWSLSYTDSIFEQFAADTLKEMFLRAVREKLFSEVQKRFFNAEKVISTLNPGSLDRWPITGQKPLFDILGGVTDDIGVVLKESFLMVPTKSVSGIIFQTDEEYHNCQLCPRVNCSGRSAPYEGD